MGARESAARAVLTRARATLRGGPSITRAVAIAGSIEQPQQQLHFPASIYLQLQTVWPKWLSVSGGWREGLPAAVLPLHQQSRSFAHKGKGKGGTTASVGKGGEEAVSAYDPGELEAEVEKSLHHFQHELSNMRSGRATPEMLDFVQVDLYGEKAPLKAAAAVSVRSPQLLVLSVYDPGAVASVVKAVRDSPLGLSPRQEGKGQEVMVPVPPPTQETVKALEKLVAKAGESAKVAIRHARHKAIEASKAAFPSKDDQKRAEKDIQRAVDAAGARIGEITKHKLKSFHQ